MTMPLLRVPIRQTSKAHLQRRAGPALRQIAGTLRRAGISAKAMVQYNAKGKGRIVVRVIGLGTVEASLLLRPFIEGFSVLCV